LKHIKAGSASITPLQKVSLALMNIYGETDIENLYKSTRYGVSYITQCSEGTRLPQPNDYQTQLAEMSADAQQIHLCFQHWGDAISHYIVLHRMPSGLYRITANRVMQITKNFRKDGILCVWPSSDPDIACGLTMALQSHVGPSMSILVEDLSLHSEVLRELMLSQNVSEIIYAHDNIDLWFARGKGVFSTTYPAPYLPFVSLPTINCLRTRPYVELPTKKSMIIRADISNTISPTMPSAYRHIIPSFTDTFTEASTTPEVTRILRFALETRLLPYLGLQKPQNRKITLFTLNFDGEYVYPVILADNMQLQSAARLPVLFLDNKPSPTLMQALYDNLFHSEFDDHNYYLHRVNSIRMFLKVIDAPDDLTKTFIRWGFNLTHEQMSQLDDLIDELTETANQ